MVTFYRSHKIEVNSQPNGQVIFDVSDRRGSPLLAGFSQLGSEPEFVARMKTRVDEFISERPVEFR